MKNILLQVSDSESLATLTGILLIAFLLFLVLRSVNLWYWKITESLKNQTRTNFLLEKILLQLNGNLAEVTIEDTTTGIKKKVRIEEWAKVKNKVEMKKYKVVKDVPDTEIV